MYVTKLINEKKYRDFILDRFPKPKGTKDLIPKSNLINNPSLIGNAFEIYFKMILKNNFNSKINFKEEIDSANFNLKWFDKSDSLFSDSKEGRHITINKFQYQTTVKLVKETFEKNEYKIFLTGGINRIEVSVDRWLELFAFQKTSGLPVMNSFSGNKFIIYCKEDISNYLKNSLVQFKIGIKDFTKTNTLTIDLLASMLTLANITNQFFKISPVKNFTFPKSYLNELKVSFCKSSIPLESLNGGKFWFKPDFRWQRILARPDCIVGDTIWELKTSKDYLSTKDYLQGITYLLFGNQKEIIDEFGTLRKLIIYYPFIGKQFEINFSDIKLNKTDQKKFSSMVKKFWVNSKC